MNEPKRYVVTLHGPAGCEYDSHGSYATPAEAWAAAHLREGQGFAVNVEDSLDAERSVNEWDEE